MNSERAPVLSADLATTLQRVVAATDRIVGPWWIIGSAAMILQGANTIEAADIDVVTSADDARRLLDDLGGATISGGENDRFRSEVFGRVSTTPTPIDIMGAFHVRRDGVWAPLAFATREATNLPFGVVFTPSQPELIGITRGFGRPKDLDRVRILEGLRNPAR